jgi:peptidoglycan-N-acetylglucosamine deacetylase
MVGWAGVLTGGCATAGVFAWAAYHPASTLFGPTIRCASSDRTIALTFDDGPNPALTPRLLDLLERHQARATFFLVGRWANAHPSIVREIQARGHTIGNHTTTHPNLVWLSKRRIVAELARCQAIIEDIIGVRPALLRPPFGARGPQLPAAVRESGLTHVVMWTLMGRDWNARGKQRLAARLASVRGGDVVVLHDGSFEKLGADREETLRSLEYWLPRWREAGLRCERL